jgi:hypothetical protein
MFFPPSKCPKALQTHVYFAVHDALRRIRSGGIRAPWAVAYYSRQSSKPLIASTERWAFSNRLPREVWALRGSTSRKRTPGFRNFTATFDTSGYFESGLWFP